MNSIRVLVTGAGSGVGQGIMKALRVSTLKPAVIVSDIAPMNAGLYRSDESILLPRVEDADSLARIIERIRKSKVDAVMIGSEFDLEFFARNREVIEAESGARVIAAPLDTVRIANDKWLTYEFLKKESLPRAEAALPSSAEEAAAWGSARGFPVILKTRTGTSNRHVHVIGSADEMIERFPTVPAPMVQEMISLPSSELGNEYTCSLFFGARGEVLGPFTARRTLRGGSSWHIEVRPFTELHPLLLGIGHRLPGLGSLNVQLMVGNNGPVPFEFNARFSGTTAVRAHFGFNEPEMALRSFILGERLDPPEVRTGLALRYLEEVFVEGVDAHAPERGFANGVVLPWF